MPSRGATLDAMRLDSHQHFWHYDAAQFPWISDRMQVLKRDYLPGDLELLLLASGVDGCITVQACQSVEDTAFLLSLADQHAFINGVVGWVDLCSDRVEGELQRFAPHPKLVGVRHIVHDEPDDDFMLRADFRRGIGRLREFDLTYDLLLFPRHIPRAVRLVEEFPEQPFVLDHIAKPLIRDGQLSPWREDLRRLARFPNVTCKLSGLVTEARWDNWRPEDIHPYLDVVVEAFGPSRLMIGSDWPVCLLAGDYRRVMDVVVGYVERLSEDERRGVLGENAARVYIGSVHSASR
jgi:L-fucono-1,5-lactonase